MATYADFARRMRQRLPDIDEEEIQRQWQRVRPADPIAEAVKGVKAGAARIGEAVGGVGEFVGRGEDIPLTDTISLPGGRSVADYWRSVVEANAPAPSLQRSVIDDPSLLADPAYWARGIAEQVPQIPFWLAGGGPLRAGAIAGTLETMPEYLQALDEGMDPAEARFKALLGVGSIGALNAIPFGQAVRKGASAAKKVGTTALAEGLTEWAEEPIQALTWGGDVLEALKQGANVAPIAAVTGGLMGGATQAYQNAQTDPQADRARRVQDLIDRLSAAPAVYAAKAYHGSPHKFDAFSMEKIGTGEGAQAYGWGLYFAESPGVAKSYQTALSQGWAAVTRKGAPIDNQYINAAMENISMNNGEITNASVKTALQKLQRGFKLQDAEAAKSGIAPRKSQEITDIQELLDNFSGYRFDQSGALYTVDIPDTAIDRMLDWDKPLSEQAESVREGLRFVGLRDLPESTKGKDFYFALASRIGDDPLRKIGEDRYFEASSALNSAGIPGIKYLDAGSRQGGQGTRNLVLFDETLVKIESRNGQPVEPAVYPMATQPVTNVQGELYSGYEPETTQIREDDLPAEKRTDFYAGTELPAATQTRQAQDNFPIHYKQVEVGQIYSGFDTVDTPQRAAHVFAPIRKHAQETMMAMVLDKNKRIVNVIRHAKGVKDGSTVSPIEVAAAVAATPEVDSVWFAHNHPSGVSDPSMADENITRRIKSTLEGAGVQINGHLVVAGPNNYSMMSSDGTVMDRGTIQPEAAPRRQPIAVTERMLRKNRPLELPVISSPESSVEVIRNMSTDHGVLLLNNRHKPIGVISMTPEEMANLRDRGQVRRILEAVDKTNAAAAITFSKNQDLPTPERESALQNLGHYLARLNDGGLRVLDSIQENAAGNYESFAQLGKSMGSTSKPFNIRTELTGQEMIPYGSRVPVSVSNEIYRGVVSEQRQGFRPNDILRLSEVGVQAPREAPIQAVEVVGSAFGDLVSMGMPSRLVDSIRGLFTFDSENNSALYIPDQHNPMIGVNAQIIDHLTQNPQDTRTSEGLRAMLAHELGHFADFGMSPVGGASMTWYKDEFSIDPLSIGVVGDKGKSMGARIEGPMGSVVEEAVRYFESNPIERNTVAGMLSYPLADIADIAPKGVTVRDESDGVDYEINEDLQKQRPDIADYVRGQLKSEVQRIQAELFAQLWMLHHINPTEMARALPKGAKFIQSYKEMINEGPTIHEARAGIQQNVWSPRAQRGADVPADQERGTADRSFAESVRDWRARGGVQKPGGDQGAVRQRSGIQSKSELSRIGNLSPTGIVGESLTPEEDILMRSVSDMFGKERARATRGKISLPELNRMAEALGMAPNELARRAIGSTWNGEQIRAGAEIVRKRSAQLKLLAEKAIGGNATDKKNFIESYYSLAEVLVPFQGVAAEAGRALGAFRGAIQGTNIRELADILNDPRVNVDEKAARIADLGNEAQVARQVGKEMTPTWGDKILELWINSLLSGPQTQAVNMLSNAVVDIFSMMEHAVASQVAAVRGSKSIPWSSVEARTMAMLQSGIAAGRMAKTVFQHEQEFGENKQEQRYQKAISGTKGRVIRIPGRLLSAGDAFYKVIAMRGSLAESYNREGRTRGLKGKDLKRYIMDGLENPSDLHYKRAMNEANYFTFTKRLGPLGSSIQKMANQFKPLRIVFPFIRTPVNIVKFAAERTPFAFAMKDVRDNLRGENGEREKDLQIARIATGSSIMMGVMMLAAQGLITGGGPSDPKDRRRLYQTGWMPYSVRYGDKWYSYGRLEPLGMLLGIAADMNEIMDASFDPEQAEEIGAMLVGAISKNLTSKTFLRGLSEVISAVTDPDRYGERYLSNLMGTVVPTLSAQIARVDDPTLRQARSITDTIRSRIPGLRAELTPAVDMYGNPIVREGGVGPDIISPIYQSQVKKDPVAEEFLRLKYRGGYAGKKIQGIELTPAEQNLYQRLIGEPARQVLEPMITSAKWNRIPDDVKEEIIDRVFRQTRKAAKPMMLKYMSQQR